MAERFIKRYFPGLAQRLGFHSSPPPEGQTIEPLAEPVSELEQLVRTPEQINSGVVIQVSPRFVYEFMFFELQVVFPSEQKPLVYNGRKEKYVGEATPWIGFRFSNNYHQDNSLVLPNSSIFGQGGLGHQGYIADRVTAFPRQGKAEIFASEHHKINLLGSENSVRGLVEALAGNRLQPPHWTQEASAFRIGEDDKGLLTDYITQHLAGYSTPVTKNPA